MNNMKIIPKFVAKKMQKNLKTINVLNISASI